MLGFFEAGDLIAREGGPAIVNLAHPTSGLTPLHLAVSNSHYEFVRNLLNNGTCHARPPARLPVCV